MKKLTLLLTASVFILSCTKSKTTVEDETTAGVIRAEITYNGDFQTGRMELISSAKPNSEKITYLNTMKQYSEGPIYETLNEVRTHSIESENAFGLNVLIIISSVPAAAQLPHNYSLSIYYNDELVDQTEVTATTTRLYHQYTWDATDKLVALTLVD